MYEVKGIEKPDSSKINSKTLTNSKEEGSSYVTPNNVLCNQF